MAEQPMQQAEHDRRHTTYYTIACYWWRSMAAAEFESKGALTGAHMTHQNVVMPL